MGVISLRCEVGTFFLQPGKVRGEIVAGGHRVPLVEVSVGPLSGGFGDLGENGVVTVNGGGRVVSS